MTGQEFKALMGKLDQLIDAVNSVDKSLASLELDLTTDDDGNSYQLPEMLMTMTKRLEHEY